MPSRARHAESSESEQLQLVAVAPSPRAAAASTVFSPPPPLPPDVLLHTMHLHNLSHVPRSVMMSLQRFSDDYRRELTTSAASAHGDDGVSWSPQRGGAAATGGSAAAGAFSATTKAVPFQLPDYVTNPFSDVFAAKKPLSADNGSNTPSAAVAVVPAADGGGGKARRSIVTGLNASAASVASSEATRRYSVAPPRQQFSRRGTAASATGSSAAATAAAAGTPHSGRAASAPRVEPQALHLCEIGTMPLPPVRTPRTGVISAPSVPIAKLVNAAHEMNEAVEWMPDAPALPIDGTTRPTPSTTETANVDVFRGVVPLRTDALHRIQLGLARNYFVAENHVAGDDDLGVGESALATAARSHNDGSSRFSRSPNKRRPERKQSTHEMRPSGAVDLNFLSRVKPPDTKRSPRTLAVLDRQRALVELAASHDEQTRLLGSTRSRVQNVLPSGHHVVAPGDPPINPVRVFEAEGLRKAPPDAVAAGDERERLMQVLLSTLSQAAPLC